MNGLQNWLSLKIAICTLLVLIPVASFPLIFDVDPDNAGMIGLLITYLMLLNLDVGWFLKSLAEFESKLISLERCKAFTTVETEKRANTQGYVENYEISWPKKGKIELKNYFTRYRPTLPYVLSDLSFTINPGEKIGIVGRTGSGKSTLFLSLLRIIEPESGSIYLDNVDISRIGLDDLRKKITIIPQDPMLFKGSLKENLDLIGQYNDNAIWDVLEKVQMKEKFNNNHGLLTEIKEGGENLSAGEKQLICIGRAILNKSKVILIDEATSNIDTGTEQKILNTIHSNFLECTVLTIAHRLQTIISSDKIMVMNQGNLVEFDAPKTLLQNEEGHFYHLWKEHENASIID